ncbi:MAG: hypothetical protein ACTS22_01525 [Phycisphaerales bacterium]
MAHDAPHLRLTNQSFASPAHRVPNGGLYQPDRLAAEVPPNPDLEGSDAPPDEQAADIRRVARRLVVAFVAIVAIGLINFTVLRQFNADLPPAVLLGTFAVILAATVISMADRQRSTTAENEDADCGCAIGACPGPRPVGELSRRAADARRSLPPRR